MKDFKGTKDMIAVANHSEAGDHVIIDKETGHLVCTMVDQNETAQANSRIFKSSPDLLEVLEMIVQDYEDGTVLKSTINKAKKAIKKALA